MVVEEMEKELRELEQLEELEQTFLDVENVEYLLEAKKRESLQETATYIPHTLDAFTKKIELVSVPNLICK